MPLFRKTLQHDASLFVAVSRLIDFPKPSNRRIGEVAGVVGRDGKAVSSNRVVLGGADEVKNLWPQAYGTSPWNAVLKEKLENRLNKEMCVGNITLKQAQDALVHDWRKAYEKYYGQP
jgi:hypothetical protein